MCQPCCCLGVQGIPKISCTQRMPSVGLTCPEEHSQALLSIAVGPPRGDQAALTLPEDLTPLRMHR